MGQGLTAQKITPRKWIRSLLTENLTVDNCPKITPQGRGKAPYRRQYIRGSAPKPLALAGSPCLGASFSRKPSASAYTNSERVMWAEKSLERALLVLGDELNEKRPSLFGQLHWRYFSGSFW